MKKLLLTCALISSASLVSFAQQSAQPATQPANAAAAPSPNRQMPTPEFIAERRSKMYEQQLKLTPDQYKGVYNAELAYDQQLQTARTSGKPMEPGQHQKMMEAKNDAFKKVLTEEQFTKYSATMRPMPPQGQPAPAPASKK